MTISGATTETSSSDLQTKINNALSQGAFVALAHPALTITGYTAGTSYGYGSNYTGMGWPVAAMQAVTGFHAIEVTTDSTGPVDHRIPIYRYLDAGGKTWITAGDDSYSNTHMGRAAFVSAASSSAADIVAGLKAGAFFASDVANRSLYCSNTATTITCTYYSDIAGTTPASGRVRFVTGLMTTNGTGTDGATDATGMIFSSASRTFTAADSWNKIGISCPGGANPATYWIGYVSGGSAALVAAGSGQPVTTPGANLSGCTFTVYAGSANTTVGSGGTATYTIQGGEKYVAPMADSGTGYGYARVWAQPYYVPRAVFPLPASVGR
jgi:hypothetical protein